MEDEVAKLLVQIQSSCVRNRRLAALHLGKHCSTADITLALINALSDAIEGVQASAAFSVGRLKAKQALNSLIDKLSDNNTSVLVRAITAKALGEIGGNKAVDILIISLSHGSNFVVQMSCIALENIGDEKAIPALLDVVINRSWHCSINAIHAVWSIKPEDARNHLLTMSNDNDLPKEYQVDIAHMLSKY